MNFNMSSQTARLCESFGTNATNVVPFTRMAFHMRSKATRLVKAKAGKRGMLVIWNLLDRNKCVPIVKMKQMTTFSRK